MLFYARDLSPRYWLPNFYKKPSLNINLSVIRFVCVSGVGVEDDAVDAEVIADLQNRIKETQKDIQVNLIAKVRLHQASATRLRYRSK